VEHEDVQVVYQSSRPGTVGNGPGTWTRSQPLLLEQLVIIGALLSASTVGQALLRVDALDRRPYRGALYLFYVDGEMRLPAFYSTAILVLCAAGLAMAARREDGSSGSRAPWAWLSLVFAVLAIDELLAFHERSIHPLRDALGIEGGLLFYAWIIPGFAVVALVGLSFVPFLRRLPPRTRRGMIISGALFLSGALGVEALGGAFEAQVGAASVPRSAGYTALTTLEEGLEMVGAALFLSTILRHLLSSPPPPGLLDTLARRVARWTVPST